MKKFFTPFFLILLLITGAEQALGENPMKYPWKLDVKFIDLLSLDFMSLYDPIHTLDKVSKIWKLQLENQRIENQDGSRARPILNLGSVPELLLKYQSETLFQWGFSFKDLILLLRIGMRAEDFNYLGFQARRENSNPFNLNLNFDFLIDFWFK